MTNRLSEEQSASAEEQMHFEQQFEQMNKLFDEYMDRSLANLVFQAIVVVAFMLVFASAIMLIYLNDGNSNTLIVVTIVIVSKALWEKERVLSLAAAIFSLGVAIGIILSLMLHMAAAYIVAPLCLICLILAIWSFICEMRSGYRKHAAKREHDRIYEGLGWGKPIATI